MSREIIINFSYIISAVLFIFGLKMLSNPATARKGNQISASGMFLAIIVTMLDSQIISYNFIILGIVIGALLGTVAARLVGMTSMPEMVALLNGFGGIASLLVGWSVYHLNPDVPFFTIITILLSVIIGGITFTGSLIAWGKLNGIVPSKPILYYGQQIINLILFVSIIDVSIFITLNPQLNYSLFLVVVLLSFIFGVLTVIPIGGADMPVVISLLNSYSGLAACAAGFAILNNLLIVAGALVGASGIILTKIMCKAMNRPITNVLFSGFGSNIKGEKSKSLGNVNPISVEDTYLILESVQSVVIIPGYGLAVAQAQHAVQELRVLLEENGSEVIFAIHPVAGRMPGHMNVLLAEANIPYDQLVEMEKINSMIETVDVCIVIGANDVVNPAARDDRNSPIYGMPVINADKAKNVIVLKRSMAAGFAGIENPLFFKKNSRLLFGDAKKSIQGLVSEFKFTGN